MADNEDDQSYDVDIDKIYQNFIQEIDNYRSETDGEKTESRCHAFYRILGLPVCDKKNIYSPGFDKPNNSNKIVLLSYSWNNIFQLLSQLW